jgi:energy-coupling factor transporter ATP-binding protein EcfA2
MNNAVLILGESGSGKSTAIRTLPPEQTFIINVIGKPLPFKGSNKIYTKLSPDGKEGNYYCSDNIAQIRKAINLVNTQRPEIKYLVLDDFGYTIMNDFMAKALLKGYDKYSELGKNFSDLINLINALRDDLFCFVMMHVESDQQGKTKPKTVGKMIDQYVCIEGKFTYVLHTIVSDGRHKFITNNDGMHMAKTPMGMFDHNLIDNDLMLVANKITEYLNEDLSQTQEKEEENEDQPND